jgi:3-hydroxyacyl-[acyl-carrier-protein] dehydratase
MRFTLVDKIVELVPGERITAIKSLTMAEEYLGDHFPRFPVLPGVLMLEALTQASAWLVRASEDFAHSIVVLKEARNVKYADFVEPGRTLTLVAEILEQDAHETKLKAAGTVDGQQAVGARLVIERYNQADRHPFRAGVDGHVRRKMRTLFAALYAAPEKSA